MGYEGLIGLGEAFKGFAEGYEKSEDKKTKRMEMEAKLAADKSAKERQATLDAVDMKKNNLMKDATGQIVEAPLTESQISKQQHDDKVSHGYNSTYDPTTKTWSSKVDPESFRAKAAAEKAARAGDAIDTRHDVTDRREHENVLRRLVNNKNLMQRLTQYQNLSNASAAITDAESVTPQQIHEFQQAIRGNMGIKGSSGVGEREETYIKSLGMNAANFKQFITGDPASLAKDSTLIRHIRDLALVEQKNIRGQFEKGIEAATAGHTSMYNRRSDLKEDRNEAIRLQLEQMGAQQTLEPAATSPNGAPVEASAGGFLSNAYGMLKNGIMGRDKPAAPAVDPVAAAKMKRLQELEAKAAGQ